MNAAFTSLIIFFCIIQGSSWVICVFCNKNLRIGKDGITSLKRHSNRRSHQVHQQAVKSLKSDQNDFLKLTQNATSIAHRSRKLELMVSLFIAKHNLALSLSDDLVELLKKIDIDKNIQRNITCNSTKCSSIIKNVTGKYVFDSLVKILRKQKFTLIIDESTDVSSTKCLALVARYRQNNDFEICDQFLGLLEVDKNRIIGAICCIIIMN